MSIDGPEFAPRNAHPMELKKDIAAQVEVVTEKKWAWRKKRGDASGAQFRRNAVATRARVMRAHVTDVSTEACLSVLNLEALAKHG